MIIRLLNIGKPALKNYHGFYGVFEIFDEIDNNLHKVNRYNPRTSNMIKRKNEMLEYLRVMEWKLIDIFSTTTCVRKINNANLKGYVHNKLVKELNSRDTRCAEANLFFFLRNFYFVFINKHNILQVSLYHLITNCNN